jgi:signal transduction histidine kinase
MPLLWRIPRERTWCLVWRARRCVSPATVSFAAAERELVVLAEVMATIDPAAPGRRARLPAGRPEVTELAAAFDEMLDRLERERRESARAVHSWHRRRSGGGLARELHDELGQALSAVLLQLDVPSTTPAARCACRTPSRTFSRRSARAPSSAAGRTSWRS